MLKAITEHPLRQRFKQLYRFKRALKCPVQVGLNPLMAPDIRHGTITFNVSGFGEIQKHFIVNDRNRLVDKTKRYAFKIARQVMLLDAQLPKNEEVCVPTRIDIVGTDVRRAYSLPSFTLLLEQTV